MGSSILIAGIGAVIGIIVAAVVLVAIGIAVGVVISFFVFGPTQTFNRVGPPSVRRFRLSDTHLCPSPNCGVDVEYLVERLPEDESSRLNLEVTKVSDDGSTPVFLVGPDADTMEFGPIHLPSTHPVFSGPGTYEFKLTATNIPGGEVPEQIRMLQIVEVDDTTNEFTVPVTFRQFAPIAPASERNELEDHAAMSNFDVVYVGPDKEPYETVIQASCKGVTLTGFTFVQAALQTMTADQIAGIVAQDTGVQPPNGFLIPTDDPAAEHPVRILLSVIVGNPPGELPFGELLAGSVDERAHINPPLLLSDQLVVRTVWRPIGTEVFFPTRRAAWVVNFHLRCPSN